jgi:TonB family protein
MAGDTVTIERQTMPIGNLILMSEPSENTDILTYLKHNLHYPKKAIENDDEGYVKVFFTVEKNGTLSNVLALERNNDLFADEVVKTLRKAKVQPIIQNGIATSYSVIVPVRFKRDR